MTRARHRFVVSSLLIALPVWLSLAPAKANPGVAHSLAQNPLPALELRDDSARLQLDAARHRALAARIVREASRSGLAVRRACPLSGCGQERPSLLAVVIEDGPRCRLGLLQRTGGRLERALSPPVDCLVERVIDAANDLITILVGRHYLRKAHEASAARVAEVVLSAGRRGAGTRVSTRRLVTPNALQAKRRRRLGIGGGLRVFSRNFRFSDPIKPANPPSYESGEAPAVAFAAELYPLAWGRRDAWAGLGLGLRFAHSLGMTSVYQASPGDAIDGTNTTFWRLDLDLRYRWQISRHRYAPDVIFTVGLGWMRFEMDSDQSLLPNVQYSYLRMGLLDIEQPLYAGQRFGLSLRGQFAVLVVFGAGDIEQENATAYGNASITGLDLGLALRARYRSFFGELGLGYRRMAFDFDRSCAQLGSCAEAGGSIDEISQLTLQFGYTL